MRPASDALASWVFSRFAVAARRVGADLHQDAQLYGALQIALRGLMVGKARWLPMLMVAWTFALTSRARKRSLRRLIRRARTAHLRPMRVVFPREDWIGKGGT